MEICIVSMIREPLETIRHFIAYHMHIGINRFILFIDGDNGEIARELSEVQGVMAFGCDDEYKWALGIDNETTSLPEQQLRFCEIALGIARTEGFDWVVHIDVDELLLPTRNISDVLESWKADALRFRLMEAVPEHAEIKGLHDSTLFRSRWECKRRILLARWLTLDVPFIKGFHYRAHKQSKCASRICENIDSIGIHKPRFKKWHKIHVCDEIILLHFDTLSIDSWLKKWRSKKKNISIDRLGVHRLMVAKRARKAINARPMLRKRLFRKTYMIRPYSKFILSSLGLLTRIQIPREHFDTDILTSCHVPQYDANNPIDSVPEPCQR